jgi:hypothetical protein
VRGNVRRANPCGGRGQRSRLSCSCVVNTKISLQKSKGCDWLKEASTSIRQVGVNGGLAEATAFANATRHRTGETAQWDGTLAAKPTKAGQAHDMRSTPRGVRQTSQDGGRRNVPFDGSRARSRNGEVFTDNVAQRSRCFGGVWAATEGSASWHISGARQAREWFDECFFGNIIHHSHHGGVKPLGARTSTSE